MKRKLSRNPVLAAVAFLLVFGLLISSGSSSADLIVRGALWAAILAMSAVAAARIIRRGGGPSYTQDATMPDRIRRWMMDEPDDRDQ